MSSGRNPRSRRAATRAAERGQSVPDVYSARSVRRAVRDVVRDELSGLAGPAVPVPFAVDAYAGRVELTLTVNGHPEVVVVPPDLADQLAQWLHDGAHAARTDAPLKIKGVTR